MNVAEEELWVFEETVPAEERKPYRVQYNISGRIDGATAPRGSREPNIRVAIFKIHELNLEIVRTGVCKYREREGTRTFVSDMEEPHDIRSLPLPKP